MCAWRRNYGKGKAGTGFAKHPFTCCVPVDAVLKLSADTAPNVLPKGSQCKTKLPPAPDPSYLGATENPVPADQIMSSVSLHSWT